MRSQAGVPGTKRSRIEDVVLNLFFVAVCATILVPFVLLLVISLTDNATLLRNGYRFVPETWSFEAYRFLFQNG